MLFSMPVPGAEAHWQHLRSEHFEMYSSAGTGNSRQALKNFERIESFFHDALKFTPKEAHPVRIIAFGSMKDYERYRPYEIAKAFYSSQPAADYIVLSDLGETVFRVAVHEYFHLVVHQSRAKLPVWLNEGMAELYSTIMPYAGGVLVGVPPTGRRPAALSEKWTPLEKVLSADASIYNEKNQAGAFYNEAWALAHLLLLGEDYIAGSKRFVQAILDGSTGPEAIQSVYGKSTSQVDKELQWYLRRADFKGRLLHLNLLKDAEVTQDGPANEYDVKVELLNLLPTARIEEVRRELFTLVESDPKRPEAHMALGYAELRSGRLDAAAAQWEAAYQLGLRNPKVLWDLAQLDSQLKPELAIEALSELLKMQPERVDVRLQLGALKLSRGDHEGALVAVVPITRVKQEDAPRLFKIKSYAYSKRGDFAAAKDNVEQWTKTAASDAERQEAARLEQYLKTPQQETLSHDAPPAAPGERPRLQRRPSIGDSGAPAAPPPERPSARGAFVELRCEAGRGIVVLSTLQGRKATYLVDKPNEVVLVGAAGGKMELSCGAQAGKMVTVEYEAAPAGSKHEGLLRVLRFE